ncbi:MAG: cytochrome c biogenesis protein CcsA [Muribaculaceae bacterium]|nr:cytochrome c biogenesis protein CcsA [Muribaculaceae bacterium]
MRHQPFTILLHIALAIILTGALATHFLGIQGILTLYTGAAPIDSFKKESGPGEGQFPFSLKLENVEVDYYPGTTTPMDFRSRLNIDGQQVTVAMNRVGEYNGWRFYQSGMSGDSTTLSVSHDPWGTGITYTGYILLGIGMIGYFFQRRTVWRAMLRKYRKGIAALMLFLALPASASENTLPTMQRPLAANFGKTLVYWNERICPIQTMARDVVRLLYDEDTYEGLTSEQVLSGWLFYYDQWQRDYLNKHPELESARLFSTDSKDRKNTERISLINWIGTGEAFRIYPYETIDGHMEWLSLTARKPSGMPLEQWTFMQTTMPEMKKNLMKGKNIKTNEIVDSLQAGQRLYGGDSLPSPAKISAEIIYNDTVRPILSAIPSLLIGLVLIIVPFFMTPARLLRTAGSIGASVLLVYLCYCMGLLWYVSDHIPVSNGPETMMFLGLAALIGATIWRNLTVRGALMVVAGIALCVAAMGGRTPQVGSMMPVLASPLLSAHVMIVMVAYALFMLMAILSTLALLSKPGIQGQRLSTLNRILLPPAVCLLGAGIFIGAVWANQTWGRYWGWDPKETCALVMWLVYALPLHQRYRPLRIFRKDKALNLYLLLAILTVAFTYFGANYLLKGLHSYA